MAILLAAASLAGCGLSPLPRGATSYGYPNDGVLLAAEPLGDHGFAFVRARPGDDTRWGVPLIISLLTRAARAVEAEQPGGAPLVIGDIAARHGGGHSRHGSHRTGRDVDVLFYLLDADGRSTRGSGFYAFDERAVGHSGVAGASPAFLDLPRNWALVRALVLDDEAPVQWIFCADGIKARLLAYGIQHERDPRVLVRAAYVLHQPSHGNPHRDHFHVRIACTARDRALGCFDPGPVWPWFRNDHEKPLWEGPGNDDMTLWRALVEDDPFSAEDAVAAAQ